jgi:uncharacterized protein (DUF2147 family)
MRPLFAILAAGAMVTASLSWSQAALTSPTGLWRTVDDKSGEVRGAIRLFESNGILYGRIEQVIDPKAIGQVCEKCTGDRHDKPILGLDVIRGVHPDGTGYWSGGEILDPESGQTYRVTLRLADDGRKLVVRGSILGGIIGRSQTWVRASP